MSMKSIVDKREAIGLGKSDEWKALFEARESAESKPTRSRSQSPGKQVQFDMKGSSAKVCPSNLDLTNFEVPGSEESRYVLTSPRSLEACSRFGVKPIELLHKSYEEFIDEFEALYDSNYSHEAIYEVFQEHERQRKRKLRLCQEERERIISERERRERDIIEDFTKRSPHSSVKEVEKQQVVRSTSSPCNLHSETTTKDNRLKSCYKTSSPELRRKIRNGCAYRHSPSGKTKIGKSQSFTGHDAKTRVDTDSDTSEGFANPHVRRVRSHWSIPKTASLPSSPRLTRRDSERFTGSSFNRFESDKQSRTMSTDSILHAVGGKRMSNKDQKIIDLMLTRHEEAQRLRKDKMALDLAWDDQRQLENDLRQARMKQHRDELYEQYTAKEMKQMEARARREKKERRLKQEKEEAIRMKQSLWEQERQKQERTLINKIELKRIADAEKKRQQEEKRRQKEREDEMNRNIAYLTTLEKHEKAMRNRNRKTTHEQLVSPLEGRKLHIQNESEKIKVNEKKEERERRLKEERRSLKDQITEKHLKAIENYEEQLIRRDSEIRNSKRKKNEKVIRQREQLTRMQEELKDWQKNLIAYREESLKRAEAVTAMNLAKKQSKTRSQLVAKRIEHAENFERVKEDEERRRMEVIADINTKDQRSETVNMEKEEIRKVSREAAQASQVVRSIVKEQTLKRADGSGDNGSTDSLV